MNTKQQNQIIKNIYNELRKKLTINGKNNFQFYTWVHDTRTPAESKHQLWKVIITIRGTRGHRDNPNRNGFTPEEFYKYCLDLIMDYIHIIATDSKNNFNVAQIENICATLDDTKLHYESESHEGCINNKYASEQLGRIMHHVWILEEMANTPPENRISKEHTYYSVIEKPKRIGQYKARETRRNTAKKSLRDLNRPQPGRGRRQPLATPQWQKVPETKMSRIKPKTTTIISKCPTPPPTPVNQLLPSSTTPSSTNLISASAMKDEELMRLKAEYVRLQQQNSDLKKNNITLQSENKALSEEIKEGNKQYIGVKTLCDDIELQNSELRGTISGLHSLIDSLERTNADQTDMISSLERTNAKQADTISSLGQTIANQNEIIGKLTDLLANSTKASQ